MASLSEAVQNAVGQPASVRVGTVLTLVPLTVDLNGAVIGGEQLGVLAGATLPAVGGAVILIGQCSDAGSDPASWVALGGVDPA